MIRFLIIILIFLFSQITHSIAKTYSTVWGFDITVNNDFVYLGVGNIDNGIDYMLKNNIGDKKQLKKFRNTLKDGRMIMFISKKYKYAQINANTQRGNQRVPRNNSQIKSFCKVMQKDFMKMLNNDVDLVDCNLDYVSEKGSAIKYKNIDQRKIDSIIYMKFFIPNLKRGFYQYYISQKNQITTFSLGCDYKNCNYLNTELLKIINSIRFK